MNTIEKKGKTGRKCLLCTHPRREALNDAIAMGKATMTQVAAQIGINKSSVSRHFRRHLQPAIVAAGGGTTLTWDVKGKSRELVERMERLLDTITSGNMTQSEVLERWPAIRSLGTEMREWMRLHGQATGELTRDVHSGQTMAIQIISGGIPGEMPRISYARQDAIDATDEGVEDIGVLQTSY